MLTKEIVMSVLVELGSVLPEEEFYDESESLLTDSEEDLKLYSNFPVDTLDKTAIMLARVDGGKYTLSLKKGSKVCFLDQNAIIRLSDVVSESVGGEASDTGEAADRVKVKMSEAKPPTPLMLLSQI